MICCSCGKTDGNIYASDPERVICTVTGKYHLKTDVCDVKPTPGESGPRMRELLFRAKRGDNGEWVEGTPFLTTGACKMIQALALHPDFTAEEGSDGHVYYCEGWPVDPDTVGQYTGLVDRNGNRIFEGDILAFNPGDGEETSFYRVEWDNARWTVSFGRGYADDDMTDWESENWTVIGNIYDNPELMGGIG